MPFDNEIKDAKNRANQADKAAKDVGQGKEDVDQAEQDLKDGDQDTADKGSNAAHDGADALRDGDQALKDLGVLGQNDNSITDVADDIDQLAEDIFGKKHAPDSLPPLRYRLFFGKKDDLEAGLENLLDDGLGIGDSLLEAGADAIGVGDYLGTDPFSSVMEKHSPFKEDPAELDAAESVWSVVQVRCDEGLNQLWRCELLLVASEVRNPDLEDQNDQESSAGGLVDQVAGPIKGVIGTVEQIAGVFDNDPNAPPPESPLAKRVAGIKGAADRLSNAGGLGDAIGAVSDIIFGEDPTATPDGPVYINVPLDPANFLGQTCSLRISREFTAPADPQVNPFDVPGYSFSARYLTGVVTEMDDLGLRQQKLAPGIGSTEVQTRWIRLVLRPQMAKLALRRDYRVFNELNAIAIVREVFRSAGVYGFLPDVPGIGMATDALGDLASNIPFVGNAASDAISGQFIKLMPPPSTNADLAKAGAKMPTEDWTQEREMCVQYGETDLDFVRRILEEEGIHFTFTCRRGFERIVLVHDPSELDQAPSVDGRAAPYYWPHWQTVPQVETVRDVAEWRKVRPAKVTLRDFSYSVADQKATELVEPVVNSPAVLMGATPEASLAYGERYEYPGKYPFQYLGKEAIHYERYGQGKLDRNLPFLRLEEEVTRSRRVRLRTNIIGAAADTTVRVRGYVFDRDGLVPPAPPTDAPPADHVIIERIRWTGSGRAATSYTAGPNYPLDTSAPDYDNEIVGWWINHAIPGVTPVRPPRVTPKPRVTSMTTATVVDWTGDHDEDEEIEHEHPSTVRVRVRFHWDRRGELPLGILPPIGYIAERGKTCWCRVSQAWAGDDFGVLFVPRIGSEVIVAFDNGDPDRPVIVGSLYDGEHPVPQPGREVPREGFEPPKAEAVQMNTIATRTSPWDEDDGVSSELTFDDTNKSERVFLKAGRHLIEEVRADHLTTVVGEQTNEVGRHQGEIVELRQKTQVEKNRDKTIGRSQVETIRGAREVRVNEHQKTLVTLDHAETVKGVQRLVVKGDRELKVHGRRETIVGKEGDETPAHDLHDVTGDKTCTIEGTLKVRAKALAVGQPTEGAIAPDSSLESGPGADGEPRLVAKSEIGYRLTADQEVRIVSNESSVELIATKGFSSTVELPMIELGHPAAGGLTVWHPTRVQIHTEHGVMVAVGDSIRLRAMGDTDAEVAVGASGVLLSGKVGIVDANKEIRDGSGVQTVGE
ncbi:MAG: hypothetical protein H6719_30010 [Sandaracinaceae bacterium]|nr:hypothetical protein [Sandaracinaceae bacterium]